MIKASISSSTNNKGLAFLQTATRNYISARLLFMHGQLFDGGVLAHEAIEKVLKSILYLDDDSRKIVGHCLEDLKDCVERKLNKDLSEFGELFSYFQECYAYRYPDNKVPTSFSTSSSYFQLLDHVFILLHDLALGLISDEDQKYQSGIYTYCDDYFRDLGYAKLKMLLESNSEVSIDLIDFAKSYWHKRGIYKASENGLTKFPGGMAIRKH